MDYKEIQAETEDRYNKLMDEIIRMRRQRGMTAMAISKLIQTDPSYMTKIEKGIFNVSLKMFIGICMAVGYDVVLQRREDAGKEEEPQ